MRAQNWRKTFVRGNEMGLIKIGTKPLTGLDSDIFTVIFYCFNTEADALSTTRDSMSGAY